MTSVKHPMIDVDGVMKHRHNSEGRPIHPTEEGIRNFHRWFGDSKAVDVHGRPLVLYHGTKSGFTSFRTGSQVHGAESGYGHYLSRSSTRASSYATSRDGDGGRVLPVYAKTEKPFTSSGYAGSDVKDMSDEDVDSISKEVSLHIQPDSIPDLLRPKVVTTFHSPTEARAHYYLKRQQWASQNGSESTKPQVLSGSGGTYRVEHYDLDKVGVGKSPWEAWRSLYHAFGPVATHVLSNAGFTSHNVGSDIIMFNSHHIKSASGNNGNFSSYTDHIGESCVPVTESIDPKITFHHYELGGDDSLRDEADMFLSGQEHMGDGDHDIEHAVVAKHPDYGVVGVSYLHHFDDRGAHKSAYVGYAVHKDFRRQGLASRLLDHSEEYLKEHDYAEIRADVVSMPSRELVTKRGWKKSEGIDWTKILREGIESHQIAGKVCREIASRKPNAKSDSAASWHGVDIDGTPHDIVLANPDSHEVAGSASYSRCVEHKDKDILSPLAKSGSRGVIRVTVFGNPVHASSRLGAPHQAILAHEITHALQDRSGKLAPMTGGTTADYVNEPHEVDAYADQAISRMMSVASNMHASGGSKGESADTAFGVGPVEHAKLASKILADVWPHLTQDNRDKVARLVSTAKTAHLTECSNTTRFYRGKAAYLKVPASNHASHDAAQAELEKHLPALTEVVPNGVEGEGDGKMYVFRLRHRWMGKPASAKLSGKVAHTLTFESVISEDLIPGGKGDAKQLGDFDPEQVAMGLKVEMEHTNDRKVAAEIVADHLSEDPHYYTKLDKSGLADK